MKTNKRNCVWAAVALAAALMTGCAPMRVEEPCVGICYRVSGGKNEMVVLGSIHVGNESMRHYGEHIESAMENADTFVFECDNDSAEAREASARLTLAPDTLRDEVSPETYGLVEQVAEKMNLSMNYLDSLRPWAATSALSTRIAAVELGVKDASAALSMGVETQVRKNARGKALAYLETAEEQLSVLDGFSPALQETLLRDACQLSLNEQPTGLREWPEWWRQGNAEAFAEAYANENELTDPVLTAEYHDGLVTRRNQKMARRLSLLLEDEQPHRYFVTIGLLHLVLPEDSVLWELEKMGYTVERLGEMGVGVAP